MSRIPYRIRLGVHGLAGVARSAQRLGEHVSDPGDRFELAGRWPVHVDDEAVEQFHSRLRRQDSAPTVAPSSRGRI